MRPSGSPADYFVAARQLRATPPLGMRGARLAVLSTSTTEMLDPYLLVESARRGLSIATSFMPFGQLEPMVLSSESDLYRASPDVVLVLARLEDLAPGLFSGSGTVDVQEMSVHVDAVERRLGALVTGLRERSDATILLANFEPAAPGATTLAEAMLPLPTRDVIQRANAALARLCADTSSAFVFDVHGLATEIGSRRWRDPKLWTLGRIAYSAEAQVALASRLARYLRALVVPRRKCLVLDLDGVLWGGVLGEEGMGGIALGEDGPGAAYKAFQRQLLALRATGVLLAIASKNNEHDVREAFVAHSDMVLAFEHFSAIEINWNDKAESLQSIARRLNIGTDALVLFDDSPVERERVRRAMPEVHVIDVPESSTAYWAAIEDAEVFDALSLSDEDRARADGYERGVAARELEERSESVEDFLRSLHMRVRIGLVDDVTLSRVEQLLGKTNQFNLTSRRHTAAQIQRMVREGAVAIWARVSDRFGDHGLTAVAIATLAGPGSWEIDSLLLSCRIIGRRIEDVLLAEVAAAVARRGGERLVGVYVATSKNSQVADLYPARGFAPVGGGSGSWVMRLPAALVTPSYIDVERAGEL